MVSPVNDVASASSSDKFDGIVVEVNVEYLGLFNSCLWCLWSLNMWLIFFFFFFLSVIFLG
jgi:hypothetical protein